MTRYLLICFFLVVNTSFGQLSFTESSTALGVGVTYGNSDLGGGVSFVDFDGDGWDDITYTSTGDQRLFFFKNNKGVFTEIDLGIANNFETKQVLWVDYDNDGDKDLFVTSSTGFNRLYQNNGTMMFTDISAICGLFTDNLFTSGAAFGDIDNDGDLDLFIANKDIRNKVERNYLYQNNNGFFVDITAAAGISLLYEPSFCASFFDYNNDGLQDIYVANDRYANMNRLYKNKGDLTFEDVSISSGAGINIDAMSTTIEDYNADGWLDIYVANTYEGNYHLRNNGDGTFTNVAQDLGTKFNSFAWGSVFLDADNDADLDLYVSGMLTGGDGFLPSAFYENIGNQYVIPFGIGFQNDTRISFSNAIGDINNDGLPDIIVMNQTQNNFLWKNTTKNSNTWLKVKLKGTTSNRDGIGSTIEVFANDKSQFRYTLCGEGYLGQNSGSEFFGLKDASTVEYVKVTWLSGTEDIITDLFPNQSITIIEGFGAITTGIEEKITNFFTIYPNPTNDGLVTLTMESLSGNPTLKVFKPTGSQILNLNLDKKNEINLKTLSKGLYYFQVQAAGKTVTKKVVYK